MKPPFRRSRSKRTLGYASGQQRRRRVGRRAVGDDDFEIGYDWRTSESRQSGSRCAPLRSGRLPRRAAPPHQGFSDQEQRAGHQHQVVRPAARSAASTAAPTSSRTGRALGGHACVRQRGRARVGSRRALVLRARQIEPRRSRRRKRIEHTAGVLARAQTEHQEQVARNVKICSSAARTSAEAALCAPSRTSSGGAPEHLQAARPVDVARPRWMASSGTSDRRSRASAVQRRHSGRRVVALVVAEQADLRCSGAKSRRASTRSRSRVRRAAVQRHSRPDLLERRPDVRGVRSTTWRASSSCGAEDARPIRAQDARLVPGDRGQRLTQRRRVVVADRRDRRHQRLEQVRGIEPTTGADLDHRHVDCPARSTRRRSAVPTSNVVGSPERGSSAATAARIGSASASTRPVEMGSPSMQVRSRQLIRCGEV